MTFIEYELSTDDGSPVELYEFSLLGTRYLYTNAEQNVVVGIDTFVSTPGIGHSEIVSTTEQSAAQVDVFLPGDNTFARLYVGILPGELPTLTIKEMHTNDPDSETVFSFQGDVAAVGFVDDFSKAELACKPITSANDRNMLRHTFQGLCNHMLYDERCGASEVNFQENVTVSSVVDRVVTIGPGELSTEVAGYWDDGFVQFGNEYRWIVSASANVFTVDIPFLESPAGSTVRVLPGCDLTIDSDCELVFGRVVSHGGSPYVPQKNPFDRLD